MDASILFWNTDAGILLLQYFEQKLAVHNSSAPMASYDKAIESYKKAITTAASVAASVMLVRSVVNELVPYEVRDVLFSGLSYLATRINNNVQRMRVSSMDESSEKMVVTMEEGEELVDMHEGTEFKWCLISRSISADPNNGNGSGQREVRSYELSFHRKHKEKALKSYLPFIIATAKAIKDQERILQIYMNEYSDSWSPIDLHHPSTFDTLAMDQKLKQSIIDDLDRFIKRKDYYKRIGKAWKRGYLLYGPPGTGKSSLIAAMANHLKFDIYDLELTEVHSNSELRRLLVGMTNRSILVVEDIDCSIELKQREAGEERTKSNSTEEDKGEDKVTLSGLLNFVDGLWSTSGEERIIIFTTNYKERLDQALLRPGRMDMHIHMGHCTPEAFRILASNYHSIDYHVTYPEIEELIKEVMVTPAEVAEALMRNDDTDVALLGLLELLLYGPPGTGKSSLIAAMANYLKFDIYDLELTEVKSNSDLRRLLVGMSNRSILVVEDIDCTIDLQQRDDGEIKRAKSTYSGEENEDKVTLSGLLNFVDGLWSTSGEERIIVFTTNYRERLDPALLRPGRMDMHIHMGYCTREAFRVLASNYHNVENHAMYPEIEQLIEEVLTTPAEVAEVLMRNDDVDVALQVLAEFLKAKRNEAGETKTENKNGNQKINKYEQSMV